MIREKEILRRLRESESVTEIARRLQNPVMSVSQLITSIKRKAKDMEEDIAFLQQIGYLSLPKGHVAFTSPGRDPKALSKRR